MNIASVKTKCNAPRIKFAVYQFVTTPRCNAENFQNQANISNFAEQFMNQSKDENAK